MLTRGVKRGEWKSDRLAAVLRSEKSKDDSEDSGYLTSSSRPDEQAKTYPNKRVRLASPEKVSPKRQQPRKLVRGKKKDVEKVVPGPSRNGKTNDKKKDRKHVYRTEFLDGDASSGEEDEDSEKIIESIETENTKQQTQQKIETEDWKDVCIPVNGIGTPIRIYQCIKRPEYVAGALCIWERKKGIDQLVDVHPNSPVGENIFIPNDAVFIIIGDMIITEPYGSALIFARVLDPCTPNERYEPVMGFYYSYHKSSSVILWSMNECFAEFAAEGVVNLYEQVPPENPAKFRKVYGMMSEAINNEMWAVDEGRRDMRNNVACNRVAPTRWRARIGGD